MQAHSILISAMERLSLARDISGVTQLIAEAARGLTGADGASFVLREEGSCYYADEDAISPLWKGRRFPAETCVSGWSMKHGSVVVIPDIIQDQRVPQDAYQPTFVKSLCLVPIRVEDPIGAIGVYWAHTNSPNEHEIRWLQTLANSTAVALENLELKKALQRQARSTLPQGQRTDELELNVCSVAHDLRTPLSAMVGLAEILRFRLSGDPMLRDFAESIIETGRQAVDQISRMLSLYRATSGELHKQSVDLSRICQEVFATMHGFIGDRGIDFQAESELKAYADPVLIRMVIENLLSNALKYTAKKSSARVRFGFDKGSFYLSDNGDGFAPEEASKLFQPLARLHSPAEFPGTGLGLASVAKIIRLHGGEVRAEGRPREGATFYFSLPLSL